MTFPRSLYVFQMSYCLTDRKDIRIHVYTWFALQMLGFIKGLVSPNIVSQGFSTVNTISQMKLRHMKTMVVHIYVFQMSYCLTDRKDIRIHVYTWLHLQMLGFIKGLISPNIVSQRLSTVNKISQMKTRHMKTMKVHIFSKSLTATSQYLLPLSLRPVSVVC